MGMPPTNKRIELPAAFVVDMRDGNVTRWNSYFDVATLMRQLGVE
jgi:predicted ester cyclase